MTQKAKQERKEEVLRNAEESLRHFGNVFLALLHGGSSENALARLDATPVKDLINALRFFYMIHDSEFGAVLGSSIALRLHLKEHLIGTGTDIIDYLEACADEQGIK